jgi:threonylcarbamoyladenosine tRNA methylthiotransferase MtaB
MRRLGAEKRKAFYRRFVGRQVSVLVEETRDQNDRRLKGLTDNYIPVRFQGPDAFYNTFQTVVIDGVSAEGVPEGEMI